MNTALKLIEAEQAKHELLTGKKVVSITRDGKKVDFQQTDLAALDRYIQSLKGQRRAIRFR